jgi:hypothetical protein
MLALCKKLGMEVPESELVDNNDFEGIPPEFNTLAKGRVLLVRRFDRSETGRVARRRLRAGVRGPAAPEIHGRKLA